MKLNFIIVINNSGINKICCLYCHVQACTNHECQVATAPTVSMIAPRIFCIFIEKILYLLILLCNIFKCVPRSSNSIV